MRCKPIATPRISSGVQFFHRAMQAIHSRRHGCSGSPNRASCRSSMSHRPCPSRPSLCQSGVVSIAPQKTVLAHDRIDSAEEALAGERSGDQYIHCGSPHLVAPVPRALDQKLQRPGRLAGRNPESRRIDVGSYGKFNELWRTDWAIRPCRSTLSPARSIRGLAQLADWQAGNQA